MKAMTPDAIKRMAFVHGAKLELGGKPVNATRTQLVPQKQVPTYMSDEPKPAPVETIEPTPDPAIREAVLSIDNYAASQFLFNEANTQLMNTVKEMLQKVNAQQPAEARPTQWVFKVKRDAQGLMETITATAK